MDIEGTIKEFIEKRFLYSKDEKGISSDDSLLDSGLIDSTGIFELVSFIEEKFGVEVLDSEITPDNFDTMGKIVAFVKTKQ